MNSRSFLLSFVAFSFLASCATAPVGRDDLVSFLRDGETYRDEIFLKLGDPSAVYEAGRILTYRLGEDEGGYFLLQKRQGFQNVNYSLVLVFDEAGRLIRHALVQVQAP